MKDMVMRLITIKQPHLSMWKKGTGGSIKVNPHVFVAVVWKDAVHKLPPWVKFGYSEQRKLVKNKHYQTFFDFYVN